MNKRNHMKVDEAVDVLINTAKEEMKNGRTANADIVMKIALTYELRGIRYVIEQLLTCERDALKAAENNLPASEK